MGDNARLQSLAVAINSQMEAVYNELDALRDLLNEFFLEANMKVQASRTKGKSPKGYTATQLMRMGRTVVDIRGLRYK